jgi:DNA-binding SARP family transcriptional activator/tetratricopeptide (TPR) repeat protein
MTVDFRLLGDVEVRIDDSLVDVGHARQRCVLVALLLEVNRPVPPDQLLERVWAGRYPHRARNVLSGYLSRLRRALAGADGVSITRQPGGYLLSTDSMAVDLYRFRHLAAKGRDADDGDEGVDLLSEALRCWRGEAFATLDTAWLNDMRGALDAERLAAELDRNDFALRAGRHAEVLVAIAALVGTHPLDERLVAQLMLALYRSGRQGDALTAYQDVRERLREELGADPGPALQELHQNILTGRDVSPVAARARNRPLPSGSPAPRQLPAPLRSFSGRTRELAALDTLVGTLDGGANTIVISAVTGSGGMGKTTLAVHWAHRNADRFPDGQLYVNLRGFDPSGTAVTPSEAIRGFLEALGVHPDLFPDSLEAQIGLYRSSLAGRRVLVVLDNARDVRHVRPLLPGAPGCLVLVTSRNQLTGLAVADGAVPLPLDLLPPDEARALLTDRIGLTRIADESQAVDDIVALCGGLPLALAIVGARAASRPGLRLAALARELGDRRSRLDALAVGDETVDLRAVFSWSHLALRPETARLFRLLGLHPGPAVSVLAATSIAGRPLAPTRESLNELALANLLSEPSPGRYAFHDLLRAYAGELVETLEPAAERQSATERMFGYYLHTANTADLLLYRHRDLFDLPELCVGVLVDDLRDERAAIDWFTVEERALAAMTRLATTGEFDSTSKYGWRLAHTMENFLDRCGKWSDWIDNYHRALDAATVLGDRTGRAITSRGLQHAYLRTSRLDDSDKYGEDALQAFGDLGDPAGQALTYLLFGVSSARCGNNEGALANCLRAFDLYDAAGHEAGRANALNNAGFAYALLGQFERCIEMCERAIALQERVGDRFVEASIWDSLGYAHHRLGDHSSAVTELHHAMRLFQEQGARHSEASTTLRLGDAYRGAGDEEAARRSWLRAMQIFEELDHPDLEALRGNLTVRLAKIGPDSAVDERVELGP